MLSTKQSRNALTDRKKAIIILALVLPAVLYLWPSMLGGSTVYIMLTGDSMEPTIELGSLVIARPELEYQVGDVIAFIDREDYEKQVVHRIVKSSPTEGYTTKGDNNAQEDSFVVKNGDILGRVIFAVPHLGSVSFFIKSPLGLALVFGIAAIPMILEKKREPSGSDTKTREPDGRNNELQSSLFLLAFGVVIGNFVLTQYFIATGIGVIDSTGLIPEIDPSLESTLLFALYTVVLMLLYFQLIKGGGASQKSKKWNLNGTTMTEHESVIFVLCIAITFFQFHNFIQLVMALVFSL